MKRVLLTIAAILLGSEGFAQLPKTDPIQKCVLIETLTGKGSGVLYRLPNGNLFVITCRHVVEDGYCMIIKDVNGRTYEPAINDTGFCRVFFANDRDMALIRITEPEYKNLQCFDQSTQLTSMSIGQIVSCYGDSQGQGVIVESTGRILGVGPVNFELDADIVPGNSGGPILLKESGKVAGIASYVSKDSDRWNQGTRFDNTVRRFGIRFDTIDWDNLSQFFSPYHGLVAQDDYSRIFILATSYKTQGNLERASIGFRWGREHGDKLCAANYGELFLNPAFSQYNPSKGVQLLRHDSNNGNEYAQGNLGEYYEKQRDYKTSLFWYKQAADNGNVFSAAKVGEFYETGKGTKTDTQQAIKYYSQAEEVSSIAAFRLGNLYEEGNSVPQDYARAYAAYLQAASDPLIDDCVNQIISTGSGNPCDDPDVFAICESRYRLAKLLQKGVGCGKDPVAAKQWLQKSHALGDPSGQAAYALAILAEKETGRLDGTLFAEAVRKNNKDALCRKGMDLLRARSYREAFSYLNQAAEKGSSQAARAIDNNPELKRYKQMQSNDPWIF